MKYLVILLIAIFFFSCRSQEVVPTEVAQFFIDGQAKSAINTPVGASESCGYFIVNSIDFKNTLPVHDLSIQLIKSGKIASMRMQLKNGRRYETQPFNPDKYITISNFKYDGQAETISFDLSGKLFIPTTDSSITVSGHFEQLSVKSFDCNALNSNLAATIETINRSIDLETLSGGASVSSMNGEVAKRTYYQYFILNNGFRVVFESGTDFKSFEAGTYKIGVDSSLPVKVTFQEYKGLSNPHYFYVYSPTDWQEYRLDGTITITDQIQLNGRSYTQGIINFTAIDSDGKSVYNVRQGSFSLLNI